MRVHCTLLPHRFDAVGTKITFEIEIQGLRVGVRPQDRVVDLAKKPDSANHVGESRQVLTEIDHLWSASHGSVRDLINPFSM